jgi:hypothetical protein
VHRRRDRHHNLSDPNSWRTWRALERLERGPSAPTLETHDGNDVENPTITSTTPRGSILVGHEHWMITPQRAESASRINGYYVTWARLGLTSRRKNCSSPGSEERWSAGEWLVVGQTRTVLRDRSKTLAQPAPCRGGLASAARPFFIRPTRGYWFSRSTSARSNRTSPP